MPNNTKRIRRLNNTFPVPKQLSLFQKIIHFLFLVFGWIIFIWMWSLVIISPKDNDSLIFLIVVSFIVFPLTSLLWILHNIKIHKRLGPRKLALNVQAEYIADWNSRKINADWAALKNAKIIVIDCDQFSKNYKIISTQESKKN